MIPEEIKKLLDSDNEQDNAIGWELVNAQGVSFKDVNEYVENTKVPTNWVIKYKWDGVKFVRNDKAINNYEAMKKISSIQTQQHIRYEQYKQRINDKRRD